MSAPANLPLSVEPLVSFHPLVVGRTAPATAAQTGSGLDLGEEPATGPDFG